MHSPLFNFIKQQYDNRFNGYTDEGIKRFVRTSIITATEYQEITGVIYTP